LTPALESTWVAVSPDLMAEDWRPSAGLPLLRARAEMLAAIRQFFADREVLEVETPLLCQASVTDPNIDSVAVGRRYLQSSPEYAMKRLLAADSGPIYQVCKAFRGADTGTRHNPEFTLLEWYRPGYSAEQLMRELRDLIELVWPGRTWSRFSYRELFQHYLSIDPFLATDVELQACARGQLELNFTVADRDAWLDLLLSHLIEPRLAEADMVFVFDYPRSQAAMARLVQRGEVIVAERFELYGKGLELANGYVELTDAAEQADRFQEDNRVLEQRGLPPRQEDERLLSALSQGLPDCVGVALGLDRLLMLQSGSDAIDQVLSFSWPRA